MDKEAKITFHRPARYRNSIRKYWIYIDGESVESISSGESKEIRLSPGEHSLHSQIMWAGSKHMKLTVEPGAEAEITVDLAGGGWSPWREFSDVDYLSLSAKRVDGVTLEEDATPSSLPRKGFTPAARVTLALAIAALLGIFGYALGGR